VNKLPCAVQEIMEQYCTTCHAKPPINGAPVSLVSWTDVKTYAEIMEMKIDGGQMPPSGAPGLSQNQSQTLLDYLAAGTPSAGNVTCP
jgi:cytochrome c5